jgi:hypothetical protein
MAAGVDDSRDEPLASSAGVGRRVAVVAMGCAAVGFGAVAPWVVPDNCRWVGWVCAVLFVPAGCGLAFIGTRGRAADLCAFSARSLTRDFAGELVGAAIAALVLGLVSVWLLLPS